MFSYGEAERLMGLAIRIVKTRRRTDVLRFAEHVEPEITKETVAAHVAVSARQKHTAIEVERG